MESCPTPDMGVACPYEPPDSLWNLVEKSTPPHEREEIKRMLGVDLVEQSIELHEELNLLLEIWRDYRDETEHLMSKSIPRLPEPPAARDRLKQEIKFFVESIREKSKDIGRDASDLLAGGNSTVIQYALDERSASSGYGSRPSTARSSTPMLTDRSRSSMLNSLSDEVAAINDKLTYLKFDQVVAHLRETLETEVLRLREDADFLQKCLDDEVDFRSQSRDGMREPSLSDLSLERSRLERELLKPQTTVPTAMRSDVTNARTSPTAMRSDVTNARTSPTAMRSDVTNARTSPSAMRSDVTNARTSPVKSIPSSIIPKTISPHTRPTPPSVGKASSSSVTSRRSPVKALHSVQTAHTHACGSMTSPSTDGKGARGAVGANKTRNSTASSDQSNRARIKSRDVQSTAAGGSATDSRKAYRFNMPEMTQHVTIRSSSGNRLQHVTAASNSATTGAATGAGVARRSDTDGTDTDDTLSNDGSLPVADDSRPSSSSSSTATLSQRSSGARPSSANRLRRLVQQCRNDDGDI